MERRERTLIDSLIHGTPREKGVVEEKQEVVGTNGQRPKVMAYLSDVFEAPRLRDQMRQYDLVLKNLSKQKSYNDESCKRDMRYHRNRYEKIYDDIRASPRSLPLKGVTSPPWPAMPHSQHPPNSDIYVDTRRGKPGDHVLFKADWRVLKEEFPPKSGQSAIRRAKLAVPVRSGKSGRAREPIISWNTPTPDIPDEKSRKRTFVAPGGYFEGSVNSEYGRTVVKAPDLTAIYATPRRSPVRPIQLPAMSERRYKPPLSDDWKTESWRRANEEYRRYREATNLSGVPVNRRVSNFEFGGGVILG